MQTKKTSRKGTKTRKPSARKRGAHVTKNSASDTIKDVAQACKVNYRRARRVARSLGLGVGKGATYNTLNKRQVAKLTKALS